MRLMVAAWIDGTARGAAREVAMVAAGLSEVR
jgi:hypothetical protein